MPFPAIQEKFEPTQGNGKIGRIGGPNKKIPGARIGRRETWKTPMEIGNMSLKSQARKNQRDRE